LSKSNHQQKGAGTVRRILYVVFILMTVLPGRDACAQLGLTTYAFTAVGLNTSQAKKYYLEGKLFTNVPFDDGIPLEFAIFRRLKHTENYRFSLGAGLNLNPFRGFDIINFFVLPVTFQVTPVQSLKNLSLIAELSPAILPEEGFMLRQLWGFRYTF